MDPMVRGAQIQEPLGAPHIDGMQLDIKAIPDKALAEQRRILLSIFGKLTGHKAGERIRLQSMPLTGVCCEDDTLTQSAKTKPAQLLCMDPRWRELDAAKTIHGDPQVSETQSTAESYRRRPL